MRSRLLGIAKDAVQRERERVDYLECKAETFLGEFPAEVSTAHYLFMANGTVDVLSPITITVPGFGTQTVPAQSGLGKVTYVNSEMSGQKDILVVANVEGIKSEGSFGSSASGTYTGSTLVWLKKGGNLEWK